MRNKIRLHKELKEKINKQAKNKPAFHIFSINLMKFSTVNSKSLSALFLASEKGMQTRLIEKTAVTPSS